MPRQGSTSNAPSLDYLRSSPVRGQLEPYDARTAKGWRYLQTTDTLDQLKVLLPPGTAIMYEQLLKLEALELNRKSSISWNRILEIRHLKDRMIRKCQKLARLSSSRKVGTAEALAFQTFIAPSDFRVKEMEKWFRLQQKRPSAVIRRPSVQEGDPQNSYCCSRCAAAAEHAEATRLPLTASTSHTHTPSSRSLMLLSAIPDSNGKKIRTAIHPKSSALTKPPARPEAAFPRIKSATATSSPSTLPSSPPPLPHPFRLQGFEVGVTDNNDTILKQSEAVQDSPKQAESPVHDPPALIRSDSTQQPGALRRRRSCIKRSSVGDMMKTVSWADDHELIDQVSKYTSAAREAQASGRKWEEIRTVYLEQMAGLETLHQHVNESLKQLRLETEHLHQADEMISRQRETLRTTFQDFERKQVQFQAKVEEALKEADQVLSIYDPKNASQTP